ncbi:MAG: hypothetical protein AABZ70_06455, partial [candidate division NC10 bacterium]
MLVDASHDLVAEVADLGIRGWVELVKGERAVLVGGEHSVGQEGVEMDVQLERGADILHEGDRSGSAARDALAACATALPAEQRA